jgi:hypothetical protein
LSEGNGHQLHALGLGEGFELGIWVDTRREDEDDGSVLVRIAIDAVEGRVGRVNEGFIAVFVDYEVDDSGKDAVSPDDFSHD